MAMLPDEPVELVTTDGVRAPADHAMQRLEFAVATVAVLAAVLLALAR
jgi:hypothetical protein